MSSLLSQATPERFTVIGADSRDMSPWLIPPSSHGVKAPITALMVRTARLEKGFNVIVGEICELVFHLAAKV